MLPTIGLTPWDEKPAGAPAHAASGGKLSWVCGVCTDGYTHVSNGAESCGICVRSGARQVDHGGEATTGCFFQAQLPAQTLRRFAGDGHAQADPAGVAVTRAFQTKERLEHRFAFIRRNARP